MIHHFLITILVVKNLAMSIGRFGKNSGQPKHTLASHLQHI